MAEGKKLAIHKNGLEVEPQNYRETPAGTPYDGLYGEAKPGLQASSPIWASETIRARTRERPTTTFDDIPQL